jgi:hypothetical protein
MILMFLIYPQHGLSNATGRAMLLFLLSPSCAPITIYDSFLRLPGIISAEIYIRQYLNLKNILDLLLDFSEIFSHSTPRINK